MTLYAAMESDGFYVVEGTYRSDDDVVSVKRVLRADFTGRPGENVRNYRFEGIALEGNTLYVGV